MSGDSAAIRSTLIAASRARAAAGCLFLQSNLVCCITPSNITVSVNASALGVGAYVGDINNIQYANPRQSMTIPVVLNVASADEETP